MHGKTGFLGSSAEVKWQFNSEGCYISRNPIIYSRSIGMPSSQFQALASMDLQRTASAPAPTDIICFLSACAYPLRRGLGQASQLSLTDFASVWSSHVCLHYSFMHFAEILEGRRQWVWGCVGGGAAWTCVVLISRDGRRASRCDRACRVVGAAGAGRTHRRCPPLRRRDGNDLKWGVRAVAVLMHRAAPRTGRREGGERCQCCSPSVPWGCSDPLCLGAERRAEGWNRGSSCRRAGNWSG